MKIATLILAVALPFAANAQAIPDLQKQAQMTSKAISALKFRNEDCRGATQQLVARAGGAGDAQALEIARIGLPFAQNAAHCFRDRDFVIAGKWKKEDNWKCRHEVRISVDAVLREFDTCE